VIDELDRQSERCYCARRSAIHVQAVLGHVGLDDIRMEDEGPLCMTECDIGDILSICKREPFEIHRRVSKLHEQQIPVVIKERGVESFIVSVMKMH